MNTEKTRRVGLPTHVGGEPLEATMARLGIKVVDDTDAPWNVVYEGTEAALREMYAEHWADSDPFPGFDGDVP